MGSGENCRGMGHINAAHRIRQLPCKGGDWGSAITTAIGMQDKGHCVGIHVNMPNASATKAARENPDEADKLALAGATFYQQWDSGYSKQQSTRPQTLGYGLADSPIGQSAWILEKFYQWTDCKGHPENVLERDEIIDNIMFYWLTNTGASSARLYWKALEQHSLEQIARLDYQQA